MNRFASLRAVVSMAASLLLAVGSVTVMPAVGPIAPAQAAENFECTAVYSIQGTGDRNVRRVNTGSGQMANEGAFSISPSSSQSLNGLGIAAGGSRAYGILPGDGNTRSVYLYDRTTETTTPLGAGESSTPVTHGAVNPQNGNYYYGGYNATTNDIEIYGFNTTTNQSMGLVASGTIPNGGRNGDWAFDQQGNMYIIGGNPGNNVLSVLNQKLPTSGSITVTGTEIANISQATDAINGVAFAGDGYLYLASGSRLFKANPGTGAVVADYALSPTSSGSVDLASCATPNTIVAQKNFPDGRVNAADQATVTITGGGITKGNTGTTTGADSGIQDQSGEYAGPVLGLSGFEYTVTESGAGTTGPGYARSWQCVNQNSNNAILASGTGTTGTFTMPEGGGQGIAALCTFTNAAQVPAIELDKVAGAATGNSAGDTITYTFVVKNSGNVPLASVMVADPKVGAVTCPAGELAPDASKTCTAAPYELTQDDVNAGKVDNTATATGTPTTPGLPTVEDDDSTTTPIEQTPKLVLDKEAGSPVDVNGNGLTGAGDTIAYTFLVTNAGNVPLSNVTVTDPMVDNLDCPKTALTPGESMMCNAAPYVVTTDDESAGSVINTAVANGQDPNNDPVEPSDDTTTTPTDVPAPKLTILKEAGTPVDVNNSGITDAGDTIAYTFTVSNTGNVPLSNITVNDPKVGAVTCEETDLAPGASTECEADEPYAVTESDELAGSVHNVATASGEDPDGDPSDPSDPSETDTPTQVPAPKLTLEKTAGTPVDVNKSGITDAGDTIQFTFTVTNDGNVPVTAISIVDPLVGAATCEETTLAPGATTGCVADEAYTITADDEIAEIVRNTATAEGVDPDGDDVVSDPDSTNTPVAQQAPALTLEKHAADPVDVNESGITDAGDTIDYTFTVTNDGNVPLFDVKVTDPIAGSVTCAPGLLAMGASLDCAADAPYVVTEADEDAGKVVNVAKANAVDPDGDDVESNEDTTTTPTTKPAPSLLVDKLAGAPVDTNRNGVADAGDTITYSFTVTNDGNVPLNDVAIDDPMLADAGIDITCPVTNLAPGAVTTCSADYVLTQGDVDAGGVKNTATATGEDPDENPTESPEDSTDTPIEAAPQLNLVKSASLEDKDGDAKADPGEQINYTFDLTNSGTVTITDLTVKDQMLADAEVEITCAATSLAPGEKTTCTALYTVTTSDVEKDEIVNVASAAGCSGLGAVGDEVCAEVISNDADTMTPVDRKTTPPTTTPGKDPLANAGGPKVAALWMGLLLLLGGAGVLLWSRRLKA